MYAYISAGNVSYDRDEAATDINTLIKQLEALREDGVTHVVGLSGNYRGAKYVALGEPEVDGDECPECGRDYDKCEC